MPKLSDVTRHVRSKNAGPFWVTVDLFFNDEASFNAYKDDPALSPALFARCFGADIALVKVIAVPSLNVVKISYPRPQPQGWHGERDMHAGQQYADLLGLELGAATTADPRVAVRHDSFFVGGEYVGPADAQVMQGQMFVEVLTPDRVTHPYPLVLIHGLAQTATNWMSTPDGRPGWAEWFAGHGWTVVMVDQPARGRSAWQPGVNGKLTSIPAPRVAARFTAPAATGSWPQAHLHTQWPGGPDKGRAGDPVFDQFYASQVASIGYAESEALMRRAGAALLDRIGPSILLTHSQAGLFGWLVADERPALVKGIVALEPGGPPYRDTPAQAAPARPWGLTETPLAYDPPPSAADPLRFQQQASPDAPDLMACWSQAMPARRLANLAGIPVLVATSEASHHAPYDHCTVRYLQQAGVPAEHIRLADQGIRGNAHMMMLELNNLEVAAFLDSWMTEHIG